VLCLCGCTGESNWKELLPFGGNEGTSEETVENETTNVVDEDELAEINVSLPLEPAIENWIDTTAREREMLEAIIQFDENKEFDLTDWAERMEAAKVGFTRDEILTILETEGCNLNRFYKQGSKFWKIYMELPHFMRYCKSLSAGVLANFSEKMGAVLENSGISEGDWSEFKAIACEYFETEDNLFADYQRTKGRAESKYGQRCNAEMEDFLKIKAEVEADTGKSEEEKSADIEAAYRKYKAVKDEAQAECENRKELAMAVFKTQAATAYAKVQEHTVYKMLMSLYEAGLLDEILNIVN